MSEPSTTKDDAVLPATRVLAAVIVPVLIVAFVVLYPVPSATDRWFAWRIDPSMTAMTLGGVYLGGAYFFWSVLQTDAWHRVAAGFLAIAALASSLGLATILHWDRFNHDHVAFWLWSGLYFGVSFVIVALWWRNQARRAPVGPSERRLSRGARLGVAVSGAGSLVLGVVMFVWPQVAIDIWPWMLTPLTARVMASILLLGAAGLGIATDPRWSSSAVIILSAQIMAALLLVAGVRASSEFFPERPLTWLFGAALIAVLVGGSVLQLRMRRQEHPR